MRVYYKTNDEELKKGDKVTLLYTSFYSDSSDNPHGALGVILEKWSNSFIVKWTENRFGEKINVKNYGYTHIIDILKIIENIELSYKNINFKIL